MVSSHFSSGIAIPQEACHDVLPSLTWTKNRPSGHSHAARPSSQLHVSSASSAHIPGLLSCGRFPDLWHLLLSFLQGLTSLNLGFCVGIKWDNHSGNSLWVMQCYAYFRKKRKKKKRYMRLFHPSSSEWTQLSWRQILLPVWFIVCVGMSAWGRGCGRGRGSYFILIITLWCRIYSLRKNIQKGYFVPLKFIM